MLRAIAILEFVAAQATPPSLSAVSRALDLSKSTAHGLLHTLVSVGWLAKEDDGGYVLGSRALSLRQRYPSVQTLKDVAAPLLTGLAAQVGHTVFLGVPEGDEVVVQLVEESDRRMRITSRPGVRLPLLAPAFGRLVLGDVGTDEAGRYLKENPIPPFTDRMPTDPERYLEQSVAASHAGFAVDDEEYMRGARAIAVPISTSLGLVALLWVAGFVHTLPEEAIEPTTRRLLKAAAAISKAIEIRLSPRGSALASVAAAPRAGQTQEVTHHESAENCSYSTGDRILKIATSDKTA